MAKKSLKVADFEKNLKSLEKLVTDLESGEMSLADGLEKFEVGVKLYKDCKNSIDEAEKKIKMLTDSLTEKSLD